MPVRRTDHRNAPRAASAGLMRPAAAAFLALGVALPPAGAHAQAANPAPPPAAAPPVNPAAPPPVNAAATPAAPGAPAPASTPAAGPSAAAASRTTSRASAVLLDQATYWSAQGRPELAQQSLERLLLVEPNNPEVLAIAAEVAALNGDRPQVEAYAARVAQLAPGTAAAARATGALRIASVDQAILADARRLAQAGQRETSIQRYREIFPDGNVPDIYASEYYQTYASISFPNFLEARRAMEAVLERNPDNRPLQLAYAQMLSTRETTRAEAIEILVRLAQAPDVAGSARAAWRQALLWQGPGPETVFQIEKYLSLFRADPEILAKLEEAKNIGRDPTAEARLQAFDALHRGQITEAEAGFEASLEKDPNDVEAMIGLGLVRYRQSRPEDLRRLFERAVEVAPGRRDELIETFAIRSGAAGRVPGLFEPPPPSLGAGVNRAAGSSGRNTSRQGQAGSGLSLRGWQALQRGRLDEAQSLGQQMARGTPAEQADAANLLGQVALRRNDLGTAELRFRESLGRRPGQADVQASLYGVIVQQGRLEEADRFAQSSGYRPSADAQGARSEQLRAQAQRQAATDQRIETLRGALAAQPTNVWASHDLARALKTVGQQDEARQVERGLIRQGTRDATYASALLSEYDGRVGETVQRLESIPAASRTADMNAMLDRNRRQLEVRQLEVAARGNPRSPAAQRLVALAGQPDATGSTQAEVIRIFNRLRQPENLEAARRAAGAEAPATPAPAKAAIAAALVDAGREGAAETLAQRAERDPRLADDLRRSATASATGPRSAARPAGGGAATEPAGRDPENWRAQLSLARVYVRSDRGADATDIAEGVLRQNPDNVEARSVAGEIAVVRNQIGRAEQLLSEGRARRADELQMALLEARIARARDDQVRARRALEDAARLRGQQLRAANP